MTNLIKDEGGFTLFETIVVLAVLAIFIATATEVMIVSSRLLQGYNSSVNNRSDAAIAIAHIDTSLKRYDKSLAISVLNESIYINTSVNTAPPLYLVYYYDKHEGEAGNPLKEVYSCSVTDIAAPIDVTANTCTLIAKNIVDYSVVIESNSLTSTKKITIDMSVKVGSSEASDKRVITLKAN